MAKVCARCGKKLGILSDVPLELTVNCVLCSECSAPISRKIGKLYNAGSKDAFELLSKEIMEDCERLYNQDISCAVTQKITEIYKKCSPNFAVNDAENYIILEKLARNQMLTTGFEFFGYTIKRYLGIVSGEVVLGTGFLSEFSASFSDFLGTKSGAFASKLEEAKNTALNRMMQRSAEQGGNAIIGVDFDYITFSNNIIGVVANGTSVLIEKISE